MHRVDTTTAAAALPAALPAGTPGYFSQGDLPGGIPATIPGQDWFNAVQEEIMAVIEEADIAGDKSDNAQLLAAILALTDHFESGTKMWFYQDTAPAGWTIDDVIGDALLAVKGGTQDYNAIGGTQQGTWDHDHDTGDCTLTAAQSGVPPHPHYVNGTSAHDEMSGAGGFAGYGDLGGNYTQQNAAQNASAPHNHGKTAGALTWRPRAAVGIICVKD